MRHLRLVHDSRCSNLAQDGGVCAVQARPLIHVPTSHIDMPEVQTSRHDTGAQGLDRQTVVVLTFNHKGDLPANLKYRLEKTAFDLCAGEGEQPNVDCQLWTGVKQ